MAHVVERQDALLRDCTKVPRLLSMPAAVSERLDRLVEHARHSGLPRPTNRSELAAALIFTSPLGGEEVAAILQIYLNATVADALRATRAAARPEAVIVELPVYGPGRRRSP